MICVSLAAAQMRPGMPNAEERAARLTERLKTELKLDNSQMQKVKEILLKHSKKIDALREKSTNRDEMIEKMKKIQVEQDNEIKNLLTKEQFKTYQKIMEESRNRMRRRD